jgi:pimeloyl-ACP methyl ester carboxylesterase/DNA-binding winged helix-turn-helix (wHTH) protein
MSPRSKIRRGRPSDAASSLRRVQRRRAPAMQIEMSNVYHFEDCVLDLDQFELRRDGEVVHVEPQVLDVLGHLISHRDRLVPKTELLDAVWGDRFVSESALTSRLKEARRAVGDDGQQQRVIATVHGRGYRFVAPVVDNGGVSRSVSKAIPQDIRYAVSPDNVCVAYAVAGDGPPLVKAANWLTHLALEWDSPIWGHWLHALAECHRLIRYDERGCGLSDWEVCDFSFDAWVDDLELVIDAAGIDRFPLLGVSQGGAVAIAYAVRHPERVSHLVLSGAYCRGRLVRAETPAEKDQAVLDRDVARIGWRRDDDAFRLVFASQFLPDGTKELWDAFNDLQRATTSTDNVVRFLETFAHVDVSRLAPKVRCPTLILHSRGDVRVPLAQARELAELIPDSRLVVLNSRNHILLEDEPAWPVFLSELDAFLAAQ